MADSPAFGMASVKPSSKRIREIIWKGIGERALRVQEISKGFDHDVFKIFTPTRIVALRFPRKIDNVRRLSVHRWINDQLIDLGIGAPKTLFQGKNYLIETFVQGSPMDKSELRHGKSVRSKKVFRQVGKALRALHAVRCGGYGELVSPGKALGRSWRACMEKEIKHYFAVIRKNKRLTREEIFRLKKWFKRIPIYSKKASLLHADMKVEHILVKDGKLEGIIDASDAIAGDPMFDFADLFIKCHPSLLQETLKAYGRTDEKRIRFYASCILLRRIAFYKENHAKNKERLFRIVGC